MRRIAWRPFVFSAALAASPLAHGAPQIGDRAPEVAFEDLLQAPAGADATLESLGGNVVILEFWTTWCIPCIAQFPHVQQMIDETADEDVQFVTVTYEPRELVERLLVKRPLDAWFAIDTDRSVLDAYEVSSFPTTIAIDRQGRVAWRGNTAALTTDLIRRIGAEGAPLREDLKEEEEEEARPRGSEALDAIERLMAKKNAQDAHEEADKAGASAGQKPAASPFDAVRRILAEGMYEAHIGPAAPESDAVNITMPGRVFYNKNTTLADAMIDVLGVSADRIEVPESIAQARYTIRLYSKNGDLDKILEEVIERGLGKELGRERRESSVYELRRVAGADGPDLHASGDGVKPHVSSMMGYSIGHALPVQRLAEALGGFVGQTVLDRTGLAGKYDWDLEWDQDDLDSLKSGLIEQLGLELAPVAAETEVFVVR